MLKKVSGKVVLLKDKHYHPFNPDPRTPRPTPGVVYPFAPTLKESNAQRKRRLG